MGLVAALSPPEKIGETTFFALPLSAVAVGTTVPFDLWLRHAGGEPILYRRRDQPFDRAQLERLAASGVERLLVAFDDAAACSRYLEAQLRRRLADPSLTQDERTRLVLDTSRVVMQEVLADPFARDAAERVGNVGDALCELLDGPNALATAVEMMEHDYYTYTHSVHVAIYALALARAAGLEDPDMLKSLGRGALMHDCGKIRLSQEILNKRGPLSDREWRAIRNHPLEGYRILQETGWTDPIVLDVCRHHHERLDGGGYPDGLRAAEISLFARISAIADAYDAMTTDRSYQRGMRGADALRVIRTRGAASYDQDLVAQFIRSLLRPA